MTETLPSGIVTSYTYNAFGQPNTETHKLNSTTQSSASYTYYVDGNLRTKSGTEPTRTYTYDTAGRLKSESETGGLTLTYSYEDNRGNRTKMTATGTESYTVSYTYDLNNRLTLESKTQGSSAENTRYTYDPNGNQISKFKMVTASGGSGNPNIISGAQDGEINTYNALGQLTELIAGTSKRQYVYRPDGLRASKTVSGTTTRHLWDLTDMAAEIGSSTTAYLRGIRLVYSKTGATGYYYRHNAHGDVYQKLNTSGSVAKTYKYDAFGNEVSPVANDTNPWRYCGEYFDKESGTVYLRARYYNPGTGRFTAEDTHWNTSNMIYGDNAGDNPTPSIAAINQSGNLYAYCMSNPLMYGDSNGQWVHLLVGALIGGVVGGAIDLGTQLLTTGEVNWRSVGASAAAGVVTGTMAAATGGISLTATAAVASGALIGGTGYLTYNLVNSSEATVSGFAASMAFGGLTAGAANGIQSYYTNKNFPGGLIPPAEAFLPAPQSAESTGNVHGNSLKSTKPQHGYEIYDISNNDVVKTGISGQPLNLNGTSPRANTQVNFLNRNAGYTQYAARVVKTNIPGRAAALSWEYANAMRLYAAKNTMNIHKYPSPPFK